jgi:hypothetical protein
VFLAQSCQKNNRMEINLEALESLLYPLEYQLDSSQEKPFFWKKINQNDLRSPYAFSVVLVTLDNYTVIIEGLNEPRIKRAIKAGLIEITSPEELDQLKEVVFESTLENSHKLKSILPFLEQQLQILEAEPIHTKTYKEALANIELLVDAANEVEW